MDDAANLELMRYYKDRNVWLVQPDSPVAKVTPYLRPGQPSSGAQ